MCLQVQVFALEAPECISFMSMLTSAGWNIWSVLPSAWTWCLRIFGSLHATAVGLSSRLERLHTQALFSLHRTSRAAAHQSDVLRDLLAGDIERHFSFTLSATASTRVASWKRGTLTDGSTKRSHWLGRHWPTLPAAPGCASDPVDEPPAQRQNGFKTIHSPNCRPKQSRHNFPRLPGRILETKEETLDGLNSMGLPEPDNGFSAKYCDVAHLYVRVGITHWQKTVHGEQTRPVLPRRPSAAILPSTACQAGRALSIGYSLPSTPSSLDFDQQQSCGAPATSLSCCILPDCLRHTIVRASYLTFHRQRQPQELGGGLQLPLHLDSGLVFERARQRGPCWF